MQAYRIIKNVNNNKINIDDIDNNKYIHGTKDQKSGTGSKRVHQHLEEKKEIPSSDKKVPSWVWLGG